MDRAQLFTRPIGPQVRDHHYVNNYVDRQGTCQHLHSYPPTCAFESSRGFGPAITEFVAMSSSPASHYLRDILNRVKSTAHQINDNFI